MQRERDRETERQREREGVCVRVRACVCVVRARCVICHIYFNVIIVIHINSSHYRRDLRCVCGRHDGDVM